MLPSDPLLVTSTVVGGIGLVLATITWILLRRTRRDLLLVRGEHDQRSIVESVAAQIRHTQDLRTDVERVQQALKIVQRDVSAALRHVSVVRFDAFGDMGGRLSFTAAILDDNGDGLLLTSIHGHTESRTYLKTVVERKVDGRTSPEEDEAIAHARPVGA